MSHIWSLPKHKPHEDYRSSRVTSPLWTASTALAERPEMISPACTWRRFVPPQRFGKPTTRFLEAQAARPLLHSLTTSWVDQGLPDHSNKGKPTIHPPQRWWPQASPPKKKMTEGVHENSWVKSSNNEFNKNPTPSTMFPAVSADLLLMIRKNTFCSTWSMSFKEDWADSNLPLLVRTCTHNVKSSRLT